MSCEIRDDIANEIQVVYAINDIFPRLTRIDFKNLTIDSFVKLCENRYRLKFDSKIVNNVFKQYKIDLNK
tara:strand:+ start:230 stop:439 length:210 start_codon:yes stop_codon:yes gene_type:complete